MRASGTMDIPPGPRHFLSLIPTFAIPSLAVYLSLTFLRDVFYLPAWFIISASVFARPVIFFANIPYSKWANRRAAASLGAVIPPAVQEWSLFTVKECAQIISGDYPGMSQAFRLNKQALKYEGGLINQFSQKYGQTFQMEVLNQCIVCSSEAV